MREMKTVIVTPQIPIAYESGGIGTFVWYFSRLLREADQDVHIVYTSPQERPRKEWMPPFEKLGISVTSIYSPSNTIQIPNGFGWHAWLAELANDAIPADADIVYFADWQGHGFHFVRKRRFMENKLPAAVTVLHGNTKWNRQGMRGWPSSYEDMAQDFLESYVPQHSDFVVSPSQYMLDWAKHNGWVLPPEDRVRVLPYPFIPAHEFPASTTEAGHKFERLVFFGRLDTRKGIDLFVNSLIALQGKPCLQSLKEVVLLGARGDNLYGEPEDIARLLQDELGDIKVEARPHLSSFEAQAYLAENRHTTLVVMPSRSETMGFAIIESSLIPGLNLICSNAGGIPEVFGPQGQDQLFEPYLVPMINKLEERLLAGPQDAAQLGTYDWKKANRGWLAFHEEVCEYVCALRSEHERRAASAPIATNTPRNQKTVDVCIPYYNLGAYLPYLLESIAQQTTQDFNLFIINDGSTDPKSVAVFEQMSQKYAQEHWNFISIENQGVCAARNLAASLGSAEYICFVDADNIAVPHMIERFTESIRRSGDDCLGCYMYLFEGEGRQYSASGLQHPAVFHYVPIGNCLTMGILDNPFGDVNCIIRRSTFEALGGFTEDVSRYINHEDRELLTRLALAGYKLDIIPEFLLFYRQRKDSRLRTTDPYLNHARVLRHYEEKLRQVGLEELAALVLGFHSRSQGAVPPAPLPVPTTAKEPPDLPVLEEEVLPQPEPGEEAPLGIETQDAVQEPVSPVLVAAEEVPDLPVPEEEVLAQPEPGEGAAPATQALDYSQVGALLARAGGDLPFLVHEVSGHTLVKALRIKVRNQIARRVGRPLVP
jgi:glycosyltransferase involved in cell wall biosynthesis